MATLRDVELPSSDEEDDDYNPEADAGAEQPKAKSAIQTGRKRGRGAFVSRGGGCEQHTDDTEAADTEQPRKAARTSEKVAAIWSQLNKGKLPTVVSKPAEASPSTVQEPVSLTALCQRIKPKQKQDADKVRPLSCLA